jgi:hypothetical protein
MYSETIQLDILDRIVQTQSQHAVNMSDPYQKWNYDFLVSERYLDEQSDQITPNRIVVSLRSRTDRVSLTDSGEQYRYRLRKNFADATKQQLIYENIIATRLDTSQSNK